MLLGRVKRGEAAIFVTPRDFTSVIMHGKAMLFVWNCGVD